MQFERLGEVMGQNEPGGALRPQNIAAELQEMFLSLNSGGNFYQVVVKRIWDEEKGPGSYYEVKDSRKVEQDERVIGEFPNGTSLGGNGEIIIVADERSKNTVFYPIRDEDTTVAAELKARFEPKKAK